MQLPKMLFAVYTKEKGLEWQVVGLSFVLVRASDAFQRFVEKPGIENINQEWKGLQNIPAGKVEGTGDAKIGKGKTQE